MKIQAGTQLYTPQTSAPNSALRLAGEEKGPEEPKDKVTTSEGTEIGDIVQKSVGGLLGIAAVIPSAYTGVLGGAIVGSMFGAGFSPAVAAVTSDGALNFIGNVLKGTGTMAKVGMAIGGFSGVVGGWKLGTGVGKLAGRALGAPKEEPGKRRKLNGVGNFAATVLTGGGMAAGGVGGAMIGAGLMATGSFIGSGFSFEGAMASAAIKGAVGGGVLGGISGAAGGYTIAKTGANIIGFGVDKATDIIDNGKDKE